MTHEEAHNVVTYLVAAGKLQPLEGQATIWRDALNHTRVRYTDAIEACRAIAAGTGSWLTPGDVIAEVRKVRATRIGNRTAPEPPPALADDPAGQQRWIRAYYAALGDGRDETEADTSACKHLDVTRPTAPEITRPTHIPPLPGELTHG